MRPAQKGRIERIKQRLHLDESQLAPLVQICFDRTKDQPAPAQERQIAEAQAEGRQVIRLIIGGEEED